MRNATVMFALGALLLAGCGAPSTATPAPGGAPGTAPASQSEPWAPTPVACAELSERAQDPTEVPLGVARVTLCSEPGHPSAGLIAPPDALVVDPDTVVRAWNELAVPGAQMACTAELGPAYRMVLEYPDGSVVQLAGEMYGCRPVGGRVASTPRPTGGADQVLDAFATALTAQRTTIPVPAGEQVRPDCDGAGSWLTPELGDTVSGFACSPSDGQPTRTDIPDADWAVIAADASANSVPAASATMPTCEKAPGPSLVGVSKAGEIISLFESCGWYQTFDRAEPRLWQPGTDAAAILAGLG